MACVNGSINATTVVRVNGRDSEAFGVRVSVHQGSVLSLICRAGGENTEMEKEYGELTRSKLR